MKWVLLVVLLLHGLIHLMGVAKAFDLVALRQLSMPITKTLGLLWLAAAILCVITAVLMLLQKDHWWMLALVAVVLSQGVIIASWQDAKFGTVANVLVAVAALLAAGSWRFENNFMADVKRHLQVPAAAQPVLTEKDIANLPAPVQRYLHYTGAVGRPLVRNMYVAMELKMRSKGKAFFPAQSVQYNFFDDPTRLFFMKAIMFGVTVPGYHCYQQQAAFMDIRFFGWVKLAQHSGAAFTRAETVTLLNDMCLLAPATLIDKRIEWQQLNDSSVRLAFTNQAHRVEATLFFNAEGQLFNFVSNDRLEVNAMQAYPFKTPVHRYGSFAGMQLPAEAEAVWQYPDGDFVYGQFWVKDVRYNVAQ